MKVLHSKCQQIWKTQQWSHNWKMSVFIPIPKKGNPKECSDYRTVALISHTSREMLKILQARLQQYVNRELPDVQAIFRKARGIRDQTASIHRIIKKVREFQTNIYFCFIDQVKAFDCGSHTLWKILKEMGIPDRLTCTLRNVYPGHYLPQAFFPIQGLNRRHQHWQADSWPLGHWEAQFNRYSFPYSTF